MPIPSWTQMVVRNLVVLESKVVDFNQFKIVVNLFDHCLLVPIGDVAAWRKVEHLLPCGLRLRAIAGLTFVENIKNELKGEFLEIEGVEEVKFELYETDNAGVFSE